VRVVRPSQRVGHHTTQPRTGGVARKRAHHAADAVGYLARRAADGLPPRFALGAVRADEGVEPLISILANRDEKPAVRARAAEALGHLGDPRALDVLAGVLTEDAAKQRRAAAEVRARAASALGRLGGYRCDPAARGRSEDRSADVRKAAARSLAGSCRRLGDGGTRAGATRRGPSSGARSSRCVGVDQNPSRARTASQRRNRRGAQSRLHEYGLGTGAVRGSDGHPSYPGGDGSTDPELEPHQSEVLRAVEMPTETAPGRHRGEEWFYLANAGPSRWLKVVVVFESRDSGRIITAFPRRRKP
jgi:hypothetical protein